MSTPGDSLFDLRQLEDLARGDSAIHRLHPLTKLLTTLGYIMVVISYDRYAISPLLPLIFYPLLVVLWADLPFTPLGKRLLLGLPLIVGIGILNPFFDPRGWLTFVSFALRSLLTISAGLLLVMTTSMDRLAYALRRVGVPRIFVLQLLLTYRYIAVLVEELARMTRAYTLRAPGQKGIQRAAWGSFAGQLLLRTYDRAQRVYDAMLLRGFTGEYHMGRGDSWHRNDALYLLGWAVWMGARSVDLPMLVGQWLMERMG
jgi:cobalt/nickel transport system permease protein